MPLYYNSSYMYTVYITYICGRRTSIRWTWTLGERGLEPLFMNIAYSKYSGNKEDWLQFTCENRYN